MCPHDPGDLETPTTPPENGHLSSVKSQTISGLTGQMSTASVNSDRSQLEAPTGQQAGFPSGHTAKGAPSSLGTDSHPSCPATSRRALARAGPARMEACDKSGTR